MTPAVGALPSSRYALSLSLCRAPLSLSVWCGRTKMATTPTNRPTSCLPTAASARSHATSPARKARRYRRPAETALRPPTHSLRSAAKIIRNLAAKCDVVVENFKVDGLAKYGLDYASIKAVNPCASCVSLPLKCLLLNVLSKEDQVLTPHSSDRLLLHHWLWTDRTA